MINEDIKKFCFLISEINRVNEFLDKGKDTFYDGGTSFEDANESVIKDLVRMQDELKELLTVLAPVSFGNSGYII